MPVGLDQSGHHRLDVVEPGAAAEIVIGAGAIFEEREFSCGQRQLFGKRDTLHADFLAAALEGGAAHTAGLSAHDILVAVDNVRVDAATNTLDAILAGYQPGQQVSVHVFRRDELRCFELTLAAPPKADCILEDARQS